MPNPGSSTKINMVKGVAKITPVTTAELTAKKDTVFAADLLFRFPDNTVRRSDGTATLENLPIVSDQVLTALEKGWLTAATSSGAYARAANGVVVHDSTGQIDDGSLKPVEQWDSDGQGTMVPHIKESYLAKYIDTTTHKMKLDALPDSARAGIVFKSTYADLATATDEDKKHIVWVLDASGDSSVTAGWAVYAWTGSAWTKFSEGEGMDIAVDDIKCDYDNVTATGAIMYDHPLMLGMTLTELDTAIAAANAPAPAGG